MNFEPINQINISLDFGRGDPVSVGRFALRDGRIYFEYDGDFIRSGLEISPLRCPLRPGVQTFDPHLFEGLPGVFNDSIPDGWGRLLLDRKARLEGLMPAQLSPLDRLAYVGHSGMGALVYKPDFGPEDAPEVLDLNRLAADAKHVLDGEASDVLQELLRLNGSSAGARPKAMIGVDAKMQNIIRGTQPMPEAFEPWLVKFPNVTDGQDAGAIEYVYALMAVEAGLEMESVHLFPGVGSAGYFATKRLIAMAALACTRIVFAACFIPISGHPRLTTRI
jgi:serine/threonine-protein kinase HipA